MPFIFILEETTIKGKSKRKITKGKISFRNFYVGVGIDDLLDIYILFIRSCT